PADRRGSIDARSATGTRTKLSSSLHFSVACQSIPIGVVQDAPRTSEALPSLGVALGAQPRRRYDALGLVAARAALHLKDRHTLWNLCERVVSREVTLRAESFHAD